MPKGVAAFDPDTRAHVVIRNSKLRSHWAPVLREWTEVINRYTNEFNSDDALYWYNERSNVGTLASAMSRCDGHVLEEYRWLKSRGGKEWTGRADLFLGIGRTCYVLEAKHAWLSIGSRARSDLHVTIDALLKAAVADVRAVRDEGAVRLGVVFLVPYLAPSDIKARDEFIPKFVDEAMAVKADLIAYTFPSGADNLVNWRGNQYPGVVCLARGIDI